MPLGAIHLIESEANRENDPVFYCRVADAIAAIAPVRIHDFPEDAICSECLRSYRAQQASGAPPAG